MNKQISLDIIDNELDLQMYLRPENAFPDYPVDKEQLQANLYSVYTEHYKECKNNISFLSQLLNIKSGIKKIYDDLEYNFNQDYEKVKVFISKSPIIEI